MTGKIDMPVGEIVASAVALLTPYLAKAGESAAQEAGKAGLGKLQELYKAICQKFNKDKDDHARQTLQDLEAEPTDEDCQAALRRILKKKAEADPSFAEALADLVNDTTQGEPVSKFVTQVFGHARVGKLVNIDEVGGDAHF